MGRKLLQNNNCGTKKAMAIHLRRTSTLFNSRNLFEFWVLAEMTVIYSGDLATLATATAIRSGRWLSWIIWVCPTA
jgi:hypothetical protein